jgi:hypothetical protein
MFRILLLITALFVTACADSTNKKFKKADDQQISTMIIEGKTTKEEVRRMFDNPNDIDFDKNGREKWTYTYSEASKNPLNFVPVVSILNGQEGTTRKMVIVFDNNVVLRYTISTDDEKIKKGVLD